MRSLYARLGDHDAITAAVDSLYDRFRGDPELAPYFAGTDVARLKRHMRPFIAAAVGGSDLYRGRDMRTAHAGLGITNAHFDRTVAHMVNAFEDVGADREAIDDLVATLEPLRALIVQASPQRLAA